jgi:phosphoribosylcarboxyaminoimidazole (NCAIR) mutase
VSFSAAKHLTARRVELVMEIIAAHAEARDLDRRRDAMRRRGWQFLAALGRWIHSAITALPGGTKAWLLLAGVVDAHRAEDALDQLVDAHMERASAAGAELAGLLEATS